MKVPITIQIKRNYVWVIVANTNTSNFFLYVSIVIAFTVSRAYFTNIVSCYADKMVKRSSTVGRCGNDTDRAVDSFRI